MYLVFHEHSSKAVEQLVWGDDLALDQQTHGHRRCRPPSRAYGHLVEPLLQRELADMPASARSSSAVVESIRCEVHDVGR